MREYLRDEKKEKWGLSICVNFHSFIYQMYTQNVTAYDTQCIIPATRIQYTTNRKLTTTKTLFNLIKFDCDKIKHIMKIVLME